MSSFRLIDSYPRSYVIPISSAKELIDKIQAIAENGHRVVLLHSPDHGTLTIGVGQPFGFVEYMNASATPPFLIAINNASDNGGFIDFDSGGTITPVSTRHCLDLQQVIDIATFFLRNGRLSATVYWENV